MSLAGLLALAAAAPAPGALRSPWDQALSALPRQAVSPCPPPPSLPAAIDASDYYSDRAHSVVDGDRLRAYQTVVMPWHRALAALEAMADRYRRDGNVATARCVADWLTRFADTGALTGTTTTNQAAYVQGWMIGALAVVWLKVRDAAPDGPVPAWLARVAGETRAYFDRRPAIAIDARNNHRAWAGFAVMAAGIAADRHDLYDWGLASYRMEASQITPAGTLPLEMARRGLALHYHLFAATALLGMAVLASANGDDLLATNDDALGRLIRATTAGLVDPKPFVAGSGTMQQLPATLGTDLAWARPLAAQLHDPAVDAELVGVRDRGTLYLGGQPP